jgi:hypothetical protein
MHFSRIDLSSTVGRRTYLGRRYLGVTLAEYRGSAEIVRNNVLFAGIKSNTHTRTVPQMREGNTLQSVRRPSSQQRKVRSLPTQMSALALEAEQHLRIVADDVTAWRHSSTRGPRYRQ